MSDNRKRPENDPWEDELDFLVWESIEKEREPQRPPDNRSRSSAPPEDFPDSRYQDPLFPPKPTYGNDRYAEPYRPPAYPPSAPPLQSSDDLYDDPYYPLPPAATDSAPVAEEQRSRRGRSRSRRRTASTAGYDVHAESGYAEVPVPRRQEPMANDIVSSRSASSRAAAISVPKPSIDDGAMVGFVAVSLLSLVLMIATLLAQSGDLPDSFPIHLDASGNADSFGDATTLWRIPFGILMAMLMSFVIAFFLWKRDRFAARFAVAGTILAQVIAWVALVDLLF